MKTAITSLCGLGIFLVSGLALAQQPQPYGGGWSGSYSPTAPPSRSSGIDNIGEEQQITFGVDRVMGVAFDQTKIEPSGVTITNKSTTVALFGNGASNTSMMIPRLALDFFVVESVSVGGSLIYISRSGEQELDPDPANTSGDTGTNSIFAISPRVGYAFAFDETFSLWPRAGITWFSSKTETPGSGGTTTDTVSGLDLTVEAMVGISPIENFAILLGPYVDLGLSGTAKNEPPSPAPSQEADSKTTSYGLTVGILGYY